MKNPLLLYTLISIMVLLWSVNFVVGKVALREFPPLLLGGLRVALAGVLISPVYWWHGRRSPGEPRWERSDLPMLIYLGLFGVALNQLFFILGLSRTSVAHSAIIIGLTPIFVLLIGALSRIEHITFRKAAGMMTALAGVLILQLFPPAGVPKSAGPTLVGDFLILLASLTFSLFTVFGKRVSKQHSTVTVNTFAYVGGALALAPATLWQAFRFTFAQVSAAGWLSLLYMALFPSVVCYLIYYYALTHITASRVSAFSYLQPLLATLMAVFLLGERVTFALVVGGAVILAGVYLTERG